MSKCNRMKLKLEPVAFDLQKVHETTQHELMHAPVYNAAACEAMSGILDYVWLGSWRDAEDPTALERNGITHVLNVAKEVPSQDEREAMERANVVSFQIPLADAHSEDIVPHFEAAFAFMDEAKAAGGKVLVHCRRGISRSPAIVVAYVMRSMKKDYISALEFVKERRPCVSLNLAFREILEDYDPETPLFGGFAHCAHHHHHRCNQAPLSASGPRSVTPSRSCEGGTSHVCRQDSQCMTEEEVSCDSESSKPSSHCVRTAATLAF